MEDEPQYANNFSTLLNKEYVSLMDSEEIPRDGWYLDNGATCHMMRECDLFQPPSSVATRCLVRCGIHTEGTISTRGLNCI